MGYAYLKGALALTFPTQTNHSIPAAVVEHRQIGPRSLAPNGTTQQFTICVN